MDAKLANFLSTLCEPRFATRDNDPKQPIILTGVIDGKEIEFVASPTDPMGYGREMHRRVREGELGRIADYIDPDDPLYALRERRKMEKGG